MAGCDHITPSHMHTHNHTQGLTACNCYDVWFLECRVDAPDAIDHTHLEFVGCVMAELGGAGEEEGASIWREGVRS